MTVDDFGACIDAAISDTPKLVLLPDPLIFIPAFVVCIVVFFVAVKSTNCLVGALIDLPFIFFSRRCLLVVVFFTFVGVAIFFVCDNFLALQTTKLAVSLSAVAVPVLFLRFCCSTMALVIVGATDELSSDSFFRDNVTCLC